MHTSFLRFLSRTRKLRKVLFTAEGKPDSSREKGQFRRRIELNDASATPGVEKTSLAIDSKLASYIPSFFPLCCVISRFVIITDSDRNLWLAVINLALDDLTATETPLQRSARAWFLSSNTNVGSFLWVCDRLGLESTAVRRRQFDLIHGVRKT